MMKASKRMLAVALAIMLVVSCIPIQPAASAASFSDMYGHWASNPIDWASGYNLVRGYDDGTFRPDNPITRAEYVSLLNRSTKDIAQQDASNVNVNFGDVSSDAWYFREVQKAVSSGYLDDDSGLFAGGENISRGEAAQLLAAAKKMQGDPYVAINAYHDSAQMNDIVLVAVGGLTENRIMSGYPDGFFRPENTLTRAEVVSMFHRYTLATGEEPMPAPEPEPTPDPEPINKGKLLPDNVWGFTNSGNNFMVDGERTKLNEQEIRAASRVFDQANMAVITSDIQEEWGGSCLGFTSTAALMLTNNLSFNGLNDNAPNKLVDVTTEAPDRFRPQSLINIYQYMQGTPLYNEKRQAAFQDGSLVRWYDDGNGNAGDIAQLTSAFKTRIDAFNNGGDPVLTSIFWQQLNRAGQLSGCGHAIISYDYEDVGNGVTKISVYDPNHTYTDGMEKSVLYLDATRNIAYGTGFGFNSATILDGDISFNGVGIDPMSLYTFFNAQNPGGLSGGGGTTMYIHSRSSESLLITADGVIHDTANPGATGLEVIIVPQGNPIYKLPYPAQNISIQSAAGNPMNVAINDGETFMSAKSGTAGSASFSRSGIVLNTQGASFEAKITSNTPPGGLGDSTVIVSGSNGSNINITKDASGYKVAGDHLSGAQVLSGSTENPTKAMQVTGADTEFYLRPTGDGQLAALIDADGDGEPEQEIGRTIDYGGGAVG